MYTHRTRRSTVAAPATGASSGFVEIAILSLGGLALTLLMIAVGYFGDGALLLGL